MENTAHRPPTPGEGLRLRELPWPLILGLSALALVRPAVSIVLHRLGVADPPFVPLLITAAISLTWILVVGLSDVARPIPTLVAVGVVYALASTALSGILSPILTDELQGPLARPWVIIPLLAFNAAWGLICGALAQALRSTRRGR